MEIYLRVEREDEHLADIEVRVEQSHTVYDVALAVVDFLGLDPEWAQVVSRDTTGPLDPSLTVAAAGILSGDTIVLGRRYPGRPTRPRRAATRGLIGARRRA